MAGAESSSPPYPASPSAGDRTTAPDDVRGGTEKPALQVSNQDGEELGLDRALKGRHLQFIAIGGTIGTGLFLGIGGALATAGPVSLLLAFIFVGAVVYSVMTGLGEMAAYMPVTGAFTVYASRFVDPSVGFAMGFIYLISWTITFALELTAAGLIIEYWNKSLNIGIWIGVFWLIFTAANFLPVRLFGELEMWFSSIKVVTIVGFIIFALCINAGAGQEGYIGFKYWLDPGAFAAHAVEGATGRFVGFWAVLITAGFSFQGTELVGIGAGETANPRKAIPSAIRWTYWGIFVLFIATVFFVGIDVPYNDPNLHSTSKNASASPLVIVANRAGVRVLPHIINAVLLTAVLTAANSDVYSSSRILIALADQGHAPAFFKATNRHGTPYWSVAFCAAFGLLGFLNLSKDGETVFKWLLNITAVAGFIVWSLINLCHLRFMRALAAQGQSRDDLPYRAPLQPYLSYFGLFFNVLILFTSGFTVFLEWDVSNFFALYISIIIFVVLFAGHKLICRTRMVKIADIDLSLGRTDP